MSLGSVLAPFLPAPPGAAAAAPSGGGAPPASTSGGAGATGGAIHGNVTQKGSGTGASVTVFGAGTWLPMLGVILLLLAVLFFAFRSFG